MTIRCSTTTRTVVGGTNRRVRHLVRLLRRPTGDGDALPAGRAEWGIVLGITLVSTVVPHLLFYEGVSRLAASRVGVVSTVEPVVTVTLGALLLAEPVTPAVIGGGGLVLAEVVLVQTDGREAVPEAPAPPDAEE
ncbi:EamA-like transporter family protein [Halobaculum gomorrense]|uniref:EamA-like transporter family protein n=2 Tax=Halobaculum gomorrense TaxID=43928 RepID=A0A1M5PEG6_9EURY|nr:EamA-like transporter family protein [Halobaculum gomorrense]